MTLKASLLCEFWFDSLSENIHIYIKLCINNNIFFALPLYPTDINSHCNQWQVTRFMAIWKNKEKSNLYIFVSFFSNPRYVVKAPIEQVWHGGLAFRTGRQLGLCLPGTGGRLLDHWIQKTNWIACSGKAWGGAASPMPFLNAYSWPFSVFLPYLQQIHG
jgi:hypothetical protein